MKTDKTVQKGTKMMCKSVLMFYFCKECNSTQILIESTASTSELQT